MESYSRIGIDRESTLIKALKKMDVENRKLLIVFQENNFLSVLSIGDIQRAIIDNRPLETSVGEIVRKDIRVAQKNDSIEEIKANMMKYRSEFMPVIDKNGNLEEVIFWEDIFGEEEIEPHNRFDIPVVIMAGGFGTRLQPLTNVLPKPLIPINKKTMLEEIFDRFSKYGVKKFHISVNYKSELIKYYIDELNLPFEINFYKEESPLGTAGSLSLMKEKIESTFFLSNCDILIDDDYSEILKYHKDNRNDITLIAALKHYPIPYGIINTEKDGILTGISEKPDLTFKVNSGIYILERELLDRIPQNKFYHITDLIDDVRTSGGRVGVYPVSEKSWKDIGEWDQLFNVISE